MKILLFILAIFFSNLPAYAAHAGQCIPQTETHEASSQEYYPVNFNSYITRKGIKKRNARPSLKLFAGQNPNHSGAAYALGKFIPGNSFIKSLQGDHILSENMPVNHAEKRKLRKWKYSPKPGSGMSWIVEIGGCKFRDIVVYSARGGSPGITKEIVANIEGTTINSSR